MGSVAIKSDTGRSNQPSRSVARQTATKQSSKVRSILHAGSRGRLQAKLRISTPGDAYEQEADRVAEKVMRMPEPRSATSLGDSSPVNGAVSQSGTIQRVHASCSGDEELIQAKTAGGQTPEVTPTISAGFQSLQGGGQMLSGTERNFFEPRFGVDFSNVRVHSDMQAASLARSVNARAFTLGRNVVFGLGEYAPGTPSGRTLLAHELAHVMQQHGRSAFYSSDNNTESTISNSKELSVVSLKITEPRIQRNGPIMSGMVDPSTEMGESGWDDIKHDAYDSLIQLLKDLQSNEATRLRDLANTLEPSRRDKTLKLIDAWEALTDVLIFYLLFEVGLAVGFAEGFFNLLLGLVQVFLGILTGVAVALYGFIDGGEAFDVWADDILSALETLPSAIVELSSRWLVDFKEASGEQRAVMIGELSGQILALFVGFELAMAKAGQVPKLTLSLEGLSGPSLQLAGGGVEAAGIGGAEIALDAASPIAVAGATGSVVLSVGGSTARDYDFDHIWDNHHPTGNVARHRGPDNSLFPEWMSRRQLEASVRRAWKNRKLIKTQDGPGGKRLKYVGIDTQNNLTLEIWYNPSTKIVETAYPVWP